MVLVTKLLCFVPRSILSQTLPLAPESVPPLPEVMEESLSPLLTSFCIGQVSGRRPDPFCWEAMSVVERVMYSATHQAGG